MSLSESIFRFFRSESMTYAHSRSSIESIAKLKNIDLDLVKRDTKATMDNKGRVEAIESLRQRFHVPLAIAWQFVDRLDRD